MVERRQGSTPSSSQLQFKFNLETNNTPHTVIYKNNIFERLYVFSSYHFTRGKMEAES